MPSPVTTLTGFVAIQLHNPLIHLSLLPFQYYNHVLPCPCPPRRHRLRCRFHCSAYWSFCNSTCGKFTVALPDEMLMICLCLGPIHACWSWRRWAVERASHLYIVIGIFKVISQGDGDRWRVLWSISIEIKEEWLQLSFVLLYGRWNLRPLSTKDPGTLSVARGIIESHHTITSILSIDKNLCAKFGLASFHWMTFTYCHRPETPWVWMFRFYFSMWTRGNPVKQVGLLCWGLDGYSVFSYMWGIQKSWSA